MNNVSVLQLHYKNKKKNKNDITIKLISKTVFARKHKKAYEVCIASIVQVNTAFLYANYQNCREIEVLLEHKVDDKKSFVQRPRLVNHPIKNFLYAIFLYNLNTLNCP